MAPTHYIRQMVGKTFVDHAIEIVCRSQIGIFSTPIAIQRTQTGRLRHLLLIFHLLYRHISFLVSHHPRICAFNSTADAYIRCTELSFQLQNTGARVLLVHPSLLDTARKASKTAGLAEDRLYLFSDTENKPIDGIQDWRSMLGSAREASNYDWPRLSSSESKTQIATVNYSSGTTGLPKGVMIVSLSTRTVLLLLTRVARRSITWSQTQNRQSSSRTPRSPSSNRLANTQPLTSAGSASSHSTTPMANYIPCSWRQN